MKTITVKEKCFDQEYTCNIKKNKSIQIDCFVKSMVNPIQTSVTFKIGDIAEYDSFNLHYLGKITSITEKTVSIKPCLKGNCDYFDKVRRLKLEEFCWRNFNFNLEKIEEFNHEESYCI